jgi:hypothetical protein
MRHVWKTGKVRTGIWWGDLIERDYSEDLGIDGRILKWIFKNCDVEAWAGLVLLRIGTGGGRL